MTNSRRRLLQINPSMKTPNQYGCISSAIASGLIYIGLCLASEFKKSKKSELRFDGRLCYLPRSPAFGFGFGALICLCVVQIAGNLFIRSGGGGCVSQVRKPTVSCVLLACSWISFGVAVILISVATSMSGSQAFGEGWLDGECYLVRDGVYIGSALLGLLALGSTLGSRAVRIRRMLSEECKEGPCTS